MQSIQSPLCPRSRGAQRPPPHLPRSGSLPNHADDATAPRQFGASRFMGSHNADAATAPCQFGASSFMGSHRHGGFYSSRKPEITTHAAPTQTRHRMYNQGLCGSISQPTPGEIYPIINPTRIRYSSTILMDKSRLLRLSRFRLLRSLCVGISLKAEFYSDSVNIATIHYARHKRSHDAAGYHAPGFRH